MKTLSKSCVQCDKIFFKKPTTSMKDWNEQTKFCSHRCYGESKKKYYTCVICGSIFNRPAFGVTPKTCSKPCRNILNSQSRKHPRKPCKVCGKPVKRAAAVYCSVKCRNIGYRGENVYNFVGEDFRKDAYTVDYAFWFKRADEIRERDKVCQHCGKVPQDNGRALDVHHIVPYRITQDNSPDNLIALCRGCHKKADHITSNT